MGVNTDPYGATSALIAGAQKLGFTANTLPEFITNIITAKRGDFASALKEIGYNLFDFTAANLGDVSKLLPEAVQKATGLLINAWVFKQSLLFLMGDVETLALFAVGKAGAGALIGGASAALMESMRQGVKAIKGHRREEHVALGGIDERKELFDGFAQVVRATDPEATDE